MSLKNKSYFLVYYSVIEKNISLLLWLHGSQDRLIVCCWQWMWFWWKSARKVIAPPLKSSLSFSIGTFLQQLWRHKKRKLILIIHSAVEKRAKRMPDITVETTLSHSQPLEIHQNTLYKNELTKKITRPYLCSFLGIYLGGG